MNSRKTWNYVEEANCKNLRYQRCTLLLWRQLRRRMRYLLCVDKYIFERLKKNGTDV